MLAAARGPGEPPAWQVARLQRDLLPSRAGSAYSIFTPAADVLAQLNKVTQFSLPKGQLSWDTTFRRLSGTRHVSARLHSFLEVQRLEGEISHLQLNMLR